MLSERLGKVLSESGARTQTEFAAEVGMPLERLRNILAGRVQRLRAEESEAIQRRFGWRDIWLREGKGAQRLTKEEQKLLCGDQAPLPALARATKLLTSLGVTDARVADFTQRVFVAAASHNDDQLKDVFTEWIKAIGKTEPASVLNGDFVRVPKHEVSASAGHGAIISDETVVDHLAFKRAWVSQALGVDPAHLALIDARGDSMSPTIESGDLLLLDTRTAQARSEGIYVINLNGSLLVKRLRIRLSGTIEVISDNVKYGSETISGQELERLVIVGRVVWHGRKI